MSRHQRSFSHSVPAGSLWIVLHSASVGSLKENGFEREDMLYVVEDRLGEDWSRTVCLNLSKGTGPHNVSLVELFCMMIA